MPNTRTPIYDSTNRRIAICIGLTFLTATATFMAGDALVVSALRSPVDSGQLALGVALQTINALAVVAIGAAFLIVLSPFQRGLAYGHFFVRILECLVIVGIGLYVLTQRNLVNYEPLIYVFTGTAGLMFTTALLRTRLVATWLVRLGVIGYIAILASLPIELLNIASLDSFPGMLLYVPGGLFELFLPIVLIARGFRPPDTPALDVGDPRKPTFAAA